MYIFKSVGQFLFLLHIHLYCSSYSCASTVRKSIIAITSALLCLLASQSLIIWQCSLFCFSGLVYSNICFGHLSSQPLHRFSIAKSGSFTAWRRQVDSIRFSTFNMCFSLDIVILLILMLSHNRLLHIFINHHIILWQYIYCRWGPSPSHQAERGVPALHQKVAWIQILVSPAHGAGSYHAHPRGDCKINVFKCPVWSEVKSCWVHL